MPHLLEVLLAVRRATLSRSSKKCHVNEMGSLFLKLPKKKSNKNHILNLGSPTYNTPSCKSGKENKLKPFLILSWLNSTALEFSEYPFIAFIIPG
jgi:hypothetical protein